MAEREPACEILAALDVPGVQPNLFQFSAAASKSAKQGAWITVLHLLERLPRHQLYPDTVLYSTAVSACEKATEWKIALALLEEMEEKSVEANAFTFSSTIKACERQGCWEAVSKLLLHMAENAVQGNSYTFNAAIGTFGKAQMWSMAMSLTKEMTIQQIQSDAITGSTLVGSLESARWTKALQAFDLLAASQVPRNDFTWNSMISACEKTWGMALQLLLAMSKQEWHPTSMSFSAALSACDHWQQTLALLETMTQQRLRVTGIQVGSVLNCISMELGKPRAIDFLKMFMANWEGGDDDQGLKERVFVPRRHMKALDLPAEILFQDESLIAVAKPAGKSSEDCLQRLANYLQQPLTRLSRLDLPTSGILVAAQGDQTAAASWWFLAQFAGRIVSKKYLCLATGDVGLPGYTEDIKLPLQVTAKDSVSRARVADDGMAAHTRFTVLATLTSSHQSFSLLLAEPFTGRTHQIRAHLAQMGFPLQGDGAYGPSATAGGPLFLHCWQMELLAYPDGARNAEDMLSLQADLPPILSDKLRKLTLLRGETPEKAGD